jgi:hypothetical protein
MTRSVRFGTLRAMDFTLRSTAVIDAPPARVFGIITDIDRLPAWNREIARVVEPCARLQVDAEWVVEIRALGARWNSRSVVVEIDAGLGRFGYRSRSDDGNPSYADWRWDVSGDPGGARVQVCVEARPRTFWRRSLLSRVRPRGLRRAMDRSLRALAEEAVRADAEPSRPQAPPDLGDLAGPP